MQTLPDAALRLAVGIAEPKDTTSADADSHPGGDLGGGGAVYEGEPTVDELAFETERLHAALVSGGDAAEAYALLNHPRLDFLDPEFRPASADAFAAFAQRVQDRTEKHPDARLYQWALRLKSTGALVGLLTGQLTIEAELRPRGQAPLEHRTVETTAYIHPDHQDVGHASEAGDQMRARLKTLFGLDRQVVRIRWDNERARRRAAKRRLVKQPGMTPQGYETWVGDL